MAVNDSTTRFSDRVADYIRYRPHYPPELFDFIETELTPGRRVSDIGSGTGISAKPLLDRDYTVYAVEPNAEMRAAAKSELGQYPAFYSVDGTGEKTTLSPGSVDWIFCAQAFHWMNPQAAKAEFGRITRNGALVSLVWNERKLSGTPLFDGYEHLLHKHGTDYGQVSHQGRDAQEKLKVFNDLKTVQFANSQRLDLTGFLGRAFSSSYTPLAGMPGHKELRNALSQLFHQCAHDGHVELLYDTTLYYSRL